MTGRMFIMMFLVGWGSGVIGCATVIAMLMYFDRPATRSKTWDS